MKLNEIKEKGFYRLINDDNIEIIFEVIENTDEEQLKECPNKTLLIDEWHYDYTDNDDRKVYSTGGLLIPVISQESLDVIKIKNKYKIYGNMGSYLIEDKLTYKEKYEHLKKLISGKECYSKLTNFIENN